MVLILYMRAGWALTAAVLAVTAVLGAGIGITTAAGDRRDTRRRRQAEPIVARWAERQARVHGPT
ncbi:hypothetical protein GCM10009527_089430 [Actinomadura nitritigenes]|uniref:hypothetical protein n=1 Tax=Actinomadura nitritigenes TaxID=134602 RepID=UPI001AAFF1D3|nr:hypothetical protein [Actinomadura nitritigenes]